MIRSYFTKSIATIRPHTRIILQVAISLFFVLIGVFFLKHERTELVHVKEALMASNKVLFGLGVLTVLAFVLVQGIMYQISFLAIKERIQLKTGMILFLKRNLVSVFLPAGMLTNVFFFSKEVIDKEGIPKTQIYYASWIFSIASIISSIIICVPALLWLLLKQSLDLKLILGLLATSILLILFFLAVRDIFKKGHLYGWLRQNLPALVEIMDQFADQSFEKQKLWQVIGWSVVVEIIGILQLYISIEALGGHATWIMSFIGYAIVLLLLMSSPFLRGIGAIEVLLTYSLTLFGFSTVLALSIAFLFRFFEFWLVLLLGLFTLLTKKDNLVIRFLPSILLVLLGLVNIISAITPAIPSRLRLLKEMIPLEAIQASTWFSFFFGIVMLALAIFLLKGLRNALLAGLLLSGLSFFIHIAKGIDWEEAFLAILVFGSLWYQRNDYFIRTDLSLAKRTIVPGLIIMTFALLFGAVGFYFLNAHHFGREFNLLQSLVQSLNAYLFLNRSLHPVTAFGRQFLLSLNVLGGVSLLYTIFLIFRPLVNRSGSSLADNKEKARELLNKYGQSSMDYFKIYSDKQFWFGDTVEGFISFRTSRNFAIALENPVCVNDAGMVKMINGFDAYCRRNGLRTAYYRIPEYSKEIYLQAGKKLFPIGEEAVLNLTTWSLDGGEKKAIRNAINKMSKQGYQVKVHDQPQSEAFLQQLRAVSDSWLKETGREELVFSQGAFDENELKMQRIIAIENREGKIMAFVNLIPDHVSGEANFDLMRKTDDAPNGTMDFLFAGLFDYLKEQGYQRCNLGLAPMSGIETPENLEERLVKLAYERIRRFEHYKSLRLYKEKFDPDWFPAYLAYDTPFDLLQLSIALEQVVQP